MLDVQKRSRFVEVSNLLNVLQALMLESGLLCLHINPSHKPKAEEVEAGGLIWAS